MCTTSHISQQTSRFCLYKVGSFLLTDHSVSTVAVASSNRLQSTVSESTRRKERTLFGVNSFNCSTTSYTAAQLCDNSIFAIRKSANFLCDILEIALQRITFRPMFFTLISYTTNTHHKKRSPKTKFASEEDWATKRSGNFRRVCE